MPNPFEELSIAAQDIESEIAASTFSGLPCSLALLMARKRKNRFAKTKAFNGFVLQQKSATENEFIDFLMLLKFNQKEVPEGTRLHLVVLTNYVDPDTDSYFHQQGLKHPKHWLAVDLSIRPGGGVNSFVLDAANSVGFTGIHRALKRMFPEGKHFVFRSDVIKVKSELNVVSKPRAIQTQTTGCEAFAMDHSRQLSQIDSRTLYGSELIRIADREGRVYPGSFIGGLKLTRILRGMQTWDGIYALPPAVLSTPIKDSTQETLLESAKKRSQDSKNTTMEMKGKHYKTKKRLFFQSLPPDIQFEVMAQRQGFTFLKNPVLFKLTTELAVADEATTLSLVAGFCDRWEKINEIKVNELKYLLRSQKKLCELKFELILTLAALFQHCDEKLPQYSPSINALLHDCLLLSVGQAEPRAFSLAS
ncbi:MAG: hypothetical protein A3F11_01225 [Gammaproteobacteria bacterium RIFCSPHIGHO2_12_FULL_37_14]|nr:MAG: hypothetical protein A3F11_01225 [Gammaproteobacteria bacterium RIFCSPHIGHO2_12_FULL_37_14]